MTQKRRCVVAKTSSTGIGRAKARESQFRITTAWRRASRRSHPFTEVGREGVWLNVDADAFRLKGYSVICCRGKPAAEPGCSTLRREEKRREDDEPGGWCEKKNGRDAREHFCGCGAGGGAAEENPAAVRVVWLITIFRRRGGGTGHGSSDFVALFGGRRGDWPAQFGFSKRPTGREVEKFPGKH